MNGDVPAIDRPIMPDGYGVPTDGASLLDWADVESRLVESAVYWLATTRPDGRPHVVPRWGVWLDGAFWYDGSPQTRHVQNLLGNAACTLHLEDGTHAVMVEGTAGPTTPPGPSLAGRLSTAFGKYKDKGYAPAPDSWEGELAGGLCRLAPAMALAWSNFPIDVTRFRWPCRTATLGAETYHPPLGRSDPENARHTKHTICMLSVCAGDAVHLPPHSRSS